MKHNIHKIKRILLLIMIVLLAVFMVAATAVTVNFKATTKDLFLYRFGGFLSLGIIEFGLLAEIDAFHIKRKIPLIKTNKLTKHIVFWIVIVVTALTFFSVPYNMTTKSFRNQLSIEAEKERTDKEKIKESHKKVSSSKTSSIKNQKETSSLSITVSDKISSTNKTKKTTEKSSLPSKVISNTDSSASKPKTKSNLKKIKTWKDFSSNSIRYKEVLSLLGKNLYKGDYNQINNKLNENEKTLVNKLLDYYSENNDLPDDFTTAFTNFCKKEGFQKNLTDPSVEGFFEVLSNSFQISLDSDGLCYIDIAKDNDKENKNTSSTDSSVDNNSNSLDNTYLPAIGHLYAGVKLYIVTEDNREILYGVVVQYENHTATVYAIEADNTFVFPTMKKSLLNQLKVRSDDPALP